MQEDLQKKFVLLSRIAKEKKYAQEYLGLLARRGDIGSIRIGKRWYTTQEWFAEFLKNSQKKKGEDVFEAKIQESAKIILKKVAPQVKEEIIINLPFTIPAEREKVYVSPKMENILSAEKAENSISIQAKNVFPEIKINRPQVSKFSSTQKKHEIKPAGLVEIKRVNLEKDNPIFRRTTGQIFSRNTTSDIKRNIRTFEINEKRKESLLTKISVAEKNKKAISYKELKMRKRESVFSPAFSEEKKLGVSFFPKFVFAVSSALILFLIAVSGYLVYSGGLLKKGEVAGASNERNGGFSGIKSGGDQYFVSAGDKMKELLSISRVFVEVAKEKAANDNPDASEVNQRAVILNQ